MWRYAGSLDVRCVRTCVCKRSPTEPFTLTELEDMHNKIIQKCAPLIDGFGVLNIYEVSYVEQTLELKEIKSAFKKDIMTVTISMSSSSSKLISRSRQRVIMMSREGLRVGRRSRARFSAMV